MTSNKEMKRIFSEYDEKMGNLFNLLNLQPFENNLNRIDPPITSSMLDIPDISLEIDTALKPLKETLDKISPELIIQNLEKSAEIMFENGWWLIPSMPFPFYTQLIELKDINQKDLTDYLVKYHNEKDCIELDNLIISWKLDEFNEKKEIFEDALWAHKKSKFTLTVPTLTVQVEGVLRNYFDPEFKPQIDGYRKKLKKKYTQTMKNKNEKLSYVDIFDNFTKMQNIKFLKNGIDTFTESFWGENPRDFDDIHRNALLHGQCKNYTREMSTKLFLFLDMIHYILNDLEK
ncbi:hypothetical protein BK007_01990 [Methanobacterium subterraneum]|uniref:Uncharacterized protein n=1 Tax=Methanobacterium subterraneum TaxID=59277 RepID=A0A2H4V9Y9_9EURY|nr:hypothetical protein [Methanobacterium subterraneum]AUB54909.1 hypothetical protein BK007_01990 [Methanobacterium subterraneum]